MGIGIFLTWIIFSFIVGIIGSNRGIGFITAFLLSIFLSPLIGIIITALSKSNDDVERDIDLRDASNYQNYLLLRKDNAPTIPQLKENESLYSLDLTKGYQIGMPIKISKIIPLEKGIARQRDVIMFIRYGQNSRQFQIKGTNKIRHIHSTGDFLINGDPLFIYTPVSLPSTKESLVSKIVSTKKLFASTVFSIREFLALTIILIHKVFSKYTRVIIGVLLIAGIGIAVILFSRQIADFYSDISSSINRSTADENQINNEGPYVDNFNYDLIQDIVEYELVSSEIIDNDRLTKISQKLALQEDSVDKNRITDLLNAIYKNVIERTGFKNRKHPNSILLMIYPSTEAEKSNESNWIAMLNRSIDQEKPEILFNQYVLTARNKTVVSRQIASEKKSGITVQFFVSGDGNKKFSELKKMGDVITEKVPGKNLYRYKIGYFSSSSEAEKALQNLISLGFEGAFIN